MKWVTREHARVDRIACPWLVTRFIDPDPTFLFVPAADVSDAARREGATPYDVPGVELGHHGERCSFDAFVGRYELETPGLATLADIVRGADTDRRTLTAESPGLHAAASGFRLVARDDHENMQLQFPLYDALYAYCRETAGTGSTRPRHVVFVCAHGAAKSVVAAAHLRRLARERGIPVTAAVAGVEPDEGWSPAAVTGLVADGLGAPSGRPRHVTLHDLALADRVVTFGCEVSRWQRAAVSIERWDDVPAVSDGYEAARTRIVARVERLVGSLGSHA
jgi:protein-tyrosine-phosphatase